jgi:hypothetical protein
LTSRCSRWASPSLLKQSPGIFHNGFKIINYLLTPAHSCMVSDCCIAHGA